MSIYILLDYVETVGKENATFEGLKAFKEEYWRD